MYILDNIDQQKAIKIIQAPISKVIYTGSKIVIFTKRPVSNRKVKEEQLTATFGLPVVIASYTNHLNWYADQENGEYYASSQFAKLRAEQLGIVVKLREAIKVVDIINLPEAGDDCWIAGMITDKLDYGFVLTDKTESIICKLDLMFDNVLKDISIGDMAKVYGKPANGKFKVKKMRVYEIDDKDTPHIEFAVKTKYSEFGSVIDIDNYISRIALRGYTAVAITDLDSVQGFPLFEQQCKSNGIKPIYGVELTVCKDDSNVIKNLQADFKLASQTYTVFDVETTGTSARYDQIIELGAAKIVNGIVTDYYHSLVKPTIKVSEISSKITGITDDMLKDAPSIEQVLKEFMEFAGDSVLVAHNADFDYSFIRAVDPDFNMTYLDTLRLARCVLTNRKRFSLASLAKDMRVKDTDHHRADNDAKVLSEVFGKLLKRLYDKGIFTAQELNKFASTMQIDRKTYTIYAYALDRLGVKQIYKMVTDAHINLYHGKPALSESKLKEYHEHVLYASGTEGSLLYEAIRDNEYDSISQLMELMDFIIITPHDNAIESATGLEVNRELVNLAKEYNKPIVLTSNARYLDEYDRPIYRALMNSKRVKTWNMSNMAAHLRTSAELYEYANTITSDPDLAYKMVYTYPNELSDKIEEFTLLENKLESPGIENSDKQLVELVANAAKQLYGDKIDEFVQARIDKELNSIIKYGFAELYILAKLVVDYSNENDYIVGSRGSVGSSLVAYLLGITEVNPLPAHYLCHNCHHVEFHEQVGCGYDLPDKDCPVCNTKMDKYGFNIPFETFTGFEGDKTPDIDLNISDEFQEQAHEYVKQLFGNDKVFRAGTILTIGERNAFGIARDYCTEHNLSDLYVKYIASRLQGVRTGTSQHPGGLLIIPKHKDVYDYTPYQYPANKEGEGYTSHIEYEYLHESIVKLDALGHLNPTILRKLKKLTGIDPETIPMGDKNVLKMFSSSELDLSPVTTVDMIGIPEYGTMFVRKMLETTKPTTFYELVRIMGLAHGTDVWNNNADMLIKTGQATLDEVIATRDDIMLYLISKGIDRKQAFNIMEKVRKGKSLSNEDIELMRDYGVPDWYIESCRKIVYLFPMAHAAAYSMMSYKIAWYKRYYPREFYCALLTKRNSLSSKYFMLSDTELLSEIKSRISNDDKADIQTLELIFDARRHGIKFYMPLVTISQGIEFIPYNDGILLPLNTLDGIGNSLALEIERERNLRQFMSIEDFTERVKLSTAQLNALTESGAIGMLGKSKVTLFDFNFER